VRRGKLGRPWYIKSLIEAARGKGIPVIYTTGERRPDNWDGGRWRWKSTRGDEASGNAHNDIDGNEIVTMIAPGPRDIVIKKQKPSGFFGTNLASYLTLLGCDSVILVGTTTSGCVRATVVDAGKSARSRHRDRPGRRHLPRYRRFESGFLHRRVLREPDFPHSCVALFFKV
jgi:nicotinamidase-related amidase